MDGITIGATDSGRHHVIAPSPRRARQRDGGERGRLARMSRLAGELEGSSHHDGGCREPQNLSGLFCALCSSRRLKSFVCGQKRLTTCWRAAINRNMGQHVL